MKWVEAVDEMNEIDEAPIQRRPCSRSSAKCRVSPLERNLKVSKRERDSPSITAEHIDEMQVLMMLRHDCLDTRRCREKKKEKRKKERAVGEFIPFLMVRAARSSTELFVERLSCWKQGVRLIVWCVCHQLLSCQDLTSTRISAAILTVELVSLPTFPHRRNYSSGNRDDTVEIKVYKEVKLERVGAEVLFFGPC